MSEPGLPPFVIKGRINHPQLPGLYPRSSLCLDVSNCGPPHLVDSVDLTNGKLTCDIWSVAICDTSAREF